MIRTFYERCALRNREMRERFGITEPTISPFELDDWLVRSAFDAKKGSDGD